MTMAGHNPLLHRPRSRWVSLQKFLVMIRLDDQGVHLAQALDQHLRGVTQISNVAETAVCGVKGITDWVNGVMRHCECLDDDIADVELGAGAKNPPVLVLSESGSSYRFRRLGVAIDRDRKYLAEHFNPEDVNAM